VTKGGRKVLADKAPAEQVAAALGVVRQIEAECHDLEDGLLKSRRVADIVLDAERPGTGTKREDTPLGWLSYRDWLRDTAREAERPAAPVKASASSDAALDAALSAAVAEKPESVQCSDGVHYVYPKSYHALEWLCSLDIVHRAALDKAIAAEALQVPEDRAVQHLAPLIRDLHVRLWVWILTHRGPELPFAEDEPLPQAPAWIDALAPQDLMAILRAHQRVNATRLSIIARAFPSDPDVAGGPSRLSLSGFIAAAAAELEPNAARKLRRETSLGQLFATRVAAAQAAREALARTKRENAT